MLTLGLKVGQAVQMGDVACVKIVAREGSTIRLGFATDIAPIRIIPSGIIPERFIHGIRPESRTPMPRLAAAS